MREERAADAVDGGGRALWATGADDVEAFIEEDIVVVAQYSVVEASATFHS